MQIVRLVSVTDFLNLYVDFLLFWMHESQQTLQPDSGFCVLEQEGRVRASGRLAAVSRAGI